MSTGLSPRWLPVLSTPVILHESSSFELEYLQQKIKFRIDYILGDSFACMQSEREESVTSVNSTELEPTFTFTLTFLPLFPFPLRTYSSSDHFLFHFES